MRVQRLIGIKNYTERHLKAYHRKYSSGFNKPKQDIVSRFLSNIIGKRILDIGCGSGVFSDYCRRQGAEVVSVDFSPIMLKFVRKADSSLHMIQTSAEYLCFKTESFDIILALDVIEHLYQPRKFMRDLEYTLKRNGVILLITDNTHVFEPSKLLSRIYHIIHYMILKTVLPPRQSTHIREYSTKEIYQFFMQAHFRILAYDTFSNVPFFKIIDKILSVFFRGHLKGYKWNRVYFYANKKEALMQNLK